MKSINKDNNLKNSLLIGIGNDGRRDDGLGWAFARMVEDAAAFSGRVSYRYQLQVEDADDVLAFPVVIFVDASQEKLAGGFQWGACRPLIDFTFSTHQLSPQTVLGICQELYAAAPEAYLLQIEGKEWALQQGLSLTAVENLHAAFAFFTSLIQTATPSPSASCV